MDQPLYSTINMNTMPGEMPLPGKTLKAQALDVDYQDLPRDMQVMRDQEYNQEVAQGQFVPEFGSLNITDPSNLIILALLLGGCIFAYCKFFRKKPAALKRKSRKRAK